MVKGLCARWHLFHRPAVSAGCEKTPTFGWDSEDKLEAVIFLDIWCEAGENSVKRERSWRSDSDDVGRSGFIERYLRGRYYGAGAAG